MHPSWCRLIHHLFVAWTDAKKHDVATLPQRRTPLWLCSVPPWEKKWNSFPFSEKSFFQISNMVCAYRCSAYIKLCCMRGETGSKSRFILFSFTTVYLSLSFDSLNTSEAMQSDRIWDPFFLPCKKVGIFSRPSKTKCYFHIESICKYVLGIKIAGKNLDDWFM